MTNGLVKSLPGVGGGDRGEILNKWISILDIALLILHFISILLERKKANDFKEQLDKIENTPKELREAAEVYASFLGYVSFALLAIHASVI